MNEIVECIDSSSLHTRKTSIEILAVVTLDIFGHGMILKALLDKNHQRLPFELLLKRLEEAVNSRGKWGTVVGSQKSWNSNNSRNTREHQITIDYVVDNLILINNLIENEKNLNRRISLRNQLQFAGFVRILQVII